MKKIKVLQFPIANNKGGITQYVLNYWEYIDKNKFQFDFATMSSSIDFKNELEKQGSKVYHVSCYAEDNREQFTKEINLILGQGYDVIHLHTSYWKGYLIEELARQHNIPKIIVHSHNTMVLEEDNEFRQKAVELHEEVKSLFSYNLATDFWACSRTAAEWLFGPQIPVDKIVIMKNAIDVKKFLFDNSVRLKYRKEMGLVDSIVLGHVGRFTFQKNHEFLIDIFKSVKREITNAKLLLVGVGPLQEDILKKVNEYGLEKDVIILGKRDDVNCLMQAMDIFCLPSRFEGLPITLIEAQCAGLRCFASDTITLEAGITKEISYLPLVKELWVKEIIQNAFAYDRKNRNAEVTEAGYNIHVQIKEMERLYET